jgi:dTDP-4-dehydrorhamnose 3,5-epimerase
MHFIETAVPGGWIIDPERHEDERGHFWRAWCSDEFAAHGIHFVPVQANMGYNIHKGTVRGMHFQEAPALEGKLMRCTRGAVFDVIIDLRPESPFFRRWYGVELTSENGRMVYVPERCGHGYQTLEECTEIYYMTSARYTPAAVRGIRFNDPGFAIEWPLHPTTISQQDRNWPLFEPRR